MALVLTRRVGEAIVVGDNIKITLGAIQGNQARYLIEAPKDIAVHREEIAKRITAEKEREKNGGS